MSQCNTNSIVIGGMPDCCARAHNSHMLACDSDATDHDFLTWGNWPLKVRLYVSLHKMILVSVSVQQSEEDGKWPIWCVNHCAVGSKGLGWPRPRSKYLILFHSQLQPQGWKHPYYHFSVSWLLWNWTFHLGGKERQDYSIRASESSAPEQWKLHLILHWSGWRCSAGSHSEWHGENIQGRATRVARDLKSSWPCLAWIRGR